MSKRVRFPIFFLSFALLVPAALADTVTLKSGERIEGVVTKETPTEVELEVKEAAGITDHKIIKKTDIARVDRLARDEVAYRAIMNFQPGPNSLQLSQYDSMIGSVAEFTVLYPESPHANEAAKALSGLQAEKKRVDAGEVKFESIWYSKADAQKQRVQMGGATAFSAMKAANASGDAIGALNAFATMEKSFPGAKVMPDAVDLARQILAGLKPATVRAVDTAKVLIKQREAGIAAADARERPEMQAAYTREQAKADAALAAATSAGLWPPFITISEKCLTAILTKITPESQRLEKIPVGPMRESIKLAEKAQTEFAAKDYAAASETLKESTKLWTANDLAVNLQAQITAAKIPPKVEPTPPPVATTATKPKPSATPTSGTASTNTSNAAVATTTATPAPTPAAAVEAPVVEEEKPFFLTLGGAITIVIVLAVILGGINAFNKLRSRANETLE
jgi:hypothetical protein